MIELVPVRAEEASCILAQGGGPPGRHWLDGAASSDDLIVLGIAADGVPTWWAIEGRHIVGMCGTHAPVVEGEPAEIGYHVAEGARRRGVAGTVVRLLLDELRLLGASQVVAEVDRRSCWADASRAVLSSCGFHASESDVALPGADRFVATMS